MRGSLVTSSLTVFFGGGGVWWRQSLAHDHSANWPDTSTPQSPPDADRWQDGALLYSKEDASDEEENSSPDFGNGVGKRSGEGSRVEGRQEARVPYV